jgi:lysophospholipase L1-like esterase
MYRQARQIRARVPQLPEASGPEGKAGSGDAEPFRLIAIGESTIAGVGVATHEEGFTGSLATELAAKLDRPVRWTVHARSGYTARRVADELVPGITERSADLVVVGLGGNDAFQLNRPGRWRRDVGRLIAALESRLPAAAILFVNMPPIREFPAFTRLIQFAVGNLVEILGEELAGVVRGRERVFYHDRVIRLADWMARPEIDATHEDFFSDGVHPSKLTYRVWAKDIADFAERRGLLV